MMSVKDHIMLIKINKIIGDSKDISEIVTGLESLELFYSQVDTRRRKLISEYKNNLISEYINNLFKQNNKEQKHGQIHSVSQEE